MPISVSINKRRNRDDGLGENKNTCDYSFVARISYDQVKSKLKFKLVEKIGYLSNVEVFDLDATCKNTA